MITRGNVTDADTTRAFGPELLACPDCGHGIDPHGTDPGGPCGVSGCPCLLQPNGIACLLIEARVREAEASSLRKVARWLRDLGHDHLADVLDARGDYHEEVRRG